MEISSLTVQVELSALVVEAVCDLVADDPADGAVVHVTRSIAGEENALENSSRKLDGILQGAVERVDDRRLPVTDPVRFVDLNEGEKC